MSDFSEYKQEIMDFQPNIFKPLKIDFSRLYNKEILINKKLSEQFKNFKNPIELIWTINSSLQSDPNKIKYKISLDETCSK